jgi:hypothetical protein
LFGAAVLLLLLLLPLLLLLQLSMLIAPHTTLQGHAHISKRVAVPCLRLTVAWPVAEAC